MTNIGVEKVPISLPLKVRRTPEQVRDLCPGPPLRRPGRNKPCARAARDRDRDLLTGLDPAHQVRGVLTKLAQPNRVHAHESSTCAISRGPGRESGGLKPPVRLTPNPKPASRHGLTTWHLGTPQADEGRGCCRRLTAPAPNSRADRTSSTDDSGVRDDALERLALSDESTNATGRVPRRHGTDGTPAMVNQLRGRRVRSSVH